MMPEKKIAIENKTDYYHKVTTISIVNNNANSSEEELGKLTAQSKPSPSKHVSIMRDDKSSQNESSITEYEIKILTEQQNDEQSNYAEYSYDEVLFPHISTNNNNGEEDRLTQILTYENSILDKSVDSKDSYISEDTTAKKDDQAGDDETYDYSNTKKSAIGVPQTLISCLNELQCGGNLVSWKITGQGENLSVKITWSNEQKMNSSKHVLHENFLTDNLENNRLWQIGNSSDYEELNEVLFKNDAFKLVQTDLSDFRSKFRNCIKCLLNGLTLKEHRKKANACKNLKCIINRS
jgi:hypothetical protein